MQKTLDVLKALALFVAIMVGAAVFVLLLQVSTAVKRTDDTLNGTFSNLNGAIAQVQKTAILSGKLINDARLSTDNLNKAAIDERFYFEHQLPGLMGQAHSILANVQVATADLHPLLTETTARTHDLAAIEAGAMQLVAHADVTVQDPNIAASLVNIEASTAQLAVASRESAAAMGSVRAMAADGQEEVHKLTHPKALDEVADWTLKVVHAIGGFF
jgi:hypothetical protein